MIEDCGYMYWRRRTDAQAGGQKESASKTELQKMESKKAFFFVRLSSSFSSDNSAPVISAGATTRVSLPHSATRHRHQQYKSNPRVPAVPTAWALMTTPVSAASPVSAVRLISQPRRIRSVTIYNNGPGPCAAWRAWFDLIFYSVDYIRVSFFSCLGRLYPGVLCETILLASHVCVFVAYLIYILLPEPHGIKLFKTQTLPTEETRRRPIPDSEKPTRSSTL